MINASRCRELHCSPFRSGMLEVDIVKPGVVGVEIVGGYHVNREPAFPISVSFDGGSRVPLQIPMIPFKLNRRRNRAVEFAQFPAFETGAYRIQIGDVSKVRVYRSMLSTQRAFANPVPVSDLSICIKESLPWGQRLLTIMSVVFGGGVMILCLVLLVLGITP